jgi:dipeptidase E
MRENKLSGRKKKRFLGGTPYIGWSAGSNVACPQL